MYMLHLQEHNVQRKAVLLESKIINCKNIILHTLLYIRLYICTYSKNYKILINSEWSMIVLVFMNACAFNLRIKSQQHQVTKLPLLKLHYHHSIRAVPDMFL